MIADIHLVKKKIEKMERFNSFHLCSRTFVENEMS